MFGFIKKLFSSKVENKYYVKFDVNGRTITIELPKKQGLYRTIIVDDIDRQYAVKIIGSKIIDTPNFHNIFYKGVQIDMFTYKLEKFRKEKLKIDSNSYKNNNFELF